MTIQSDEVTTEQRVLWAMSVIPLAWLTAQDIAGEMNIRGDGRTIAPELKSLLAQGRIIQNTTGKPTEYHLSEKEAARVEIAWASNGGPVHDHVNNRDLSKPEIEAYIKNLKEEWGL